MNSVVSLQNINKFYKLGGNRFKVLDNIDLDIKKGEFIAIIGPSGSGKSTLMHIIGLLDTASSGTISLMGKEINKTNEKDLATLRNKHIGFVFQAFNLLPRTSALDNVELPLIYGGVSKDERTKRAIEVLEQVGLGERINNKPSQLSGGQQQRVAIARALANDPEVILADEPTGNLDSKTGMFVMDFLGKMNKEGKTIVLVTHDLNLVHYAKRIVYIKDGRIERDVQNGRRETK